MEPKLKKFLLGPDAEKEARKALRVLIGHLRKEKGQHVRERIVVVINTKVIFAKQKDYTPRIIPVSHKLEKLESKSVLLITKDPATFHRKKLTEKDSPTEEVFNQIYSMSKIKLVARDAKQLYKLYKEIDVVVADDRIHKFLPGVLKAQFYEKNRKVPYMLQLAKPVPTVKNKKVQPEERCEPKYVKAQLKSIVGNPSYISPVDSSSVTIKIGFSDWEIDHLVQNLDDIIRYLVDVKFQPVGGILKTKDKITGVFVKTSESISMPVYLAPVKEESDDNYSDYDV